MGIERADRVERGITVATITLNHPPVHILDLAHCEELQSALAEVRADDRARVLVLRGAGRCFSAGVDIKQHTKELMPALLPAFHSIFFELLGLQSVNVALVNGVCMGGAAELAFACDRVIAEENARISFPEIQLGCYPPVAIPLLTQRAGHGRAVAAVLGGREIPVAAFAQWGLVDVVAPAGGLDDALQREIALYHDKSPAVLGMTAHLLHEEALRTWGSRIKHMEAEYLEKLLPHPDVAEGIAAFAAKRPARWRSLDEGIDLDRIEGMAQ